MILNAITTLIMAFLGTLRDVLPILLILGFFQLAVLRRPIPNLKNVASGLLLVIAGLALFLVGLEQALFPLGEIMAKQLTDPAFIADGEADAVLAWYQYGWVYLFALAIGFSTTIAEPSLIAVALKARDASGGALNPWGLRIAVAIGVSLSVAIGTFRIVTGTPLALYMVVGYLIVVVQTLFAPKTIIPLAYDSGGVTTSTVTVPLVTALGLGLASTVPGRSPLIDGFGLIALASLFPMITVMGYAQLAESELLKKSQMRLGVRLPAFWKAATLRASNLKAAILKKDKKNEIQDDHGADLRREDEQGVQSGKRPGGDGEHRH